MPSVYLPAAHVGNAETELSHFTEIFDLLFLFVVSGLEAFAHVEVAGAVVGVGVEAFFVSAMQRVVLGQIGQFLSFFLFGC